MSITLPAESSSSALAVPAGDGPAVIVPAESSSSASAVPAGGGPAVVVPSVVVPAASSSSASAGDAGAIIPSKRFYGKSLSRPYPERERRDRIHKKPRRYQ